MSPETLDSVKRAALAIYAIAERETLNAPTEREEREAAECIRQTAAAILRAVDGAYGGEETKEIGG